MRQPPATLRVGLAQIDSCLGDVERNVETHLQSILQARSQGVELLVFPELSLTGYRLLHLTSRVAARPDASAAVRAIAELAHKIVALHALTDLKQGITVNVGLVKGGQSVNTTAPHADGHIDLRYVKPEQRSAALAAIRSIMDTATVPGTTAKFEIRGEFLPVTGSPAADALFETYQAAAADAGLKVAGEFSGGCADSGFTAAVGSPTLCGLGPVGAVVGFYLPKLLLANTVQKRQHEMAMAFPDALDLLTICVEAGLGIEGAFARITEEIASASPILAQEFGLLSAELAFLGDRRQAYENFSKRTGMPAAKALATASNLLVLDEPTNDLDLETLDLLQEMLADYPGTVILVSHDRDFLDRVATSVLMAEGHGRFVEYAGGYSDMVAQRGEGVAARPREAKVAKASVQRAAPASERRKLTFKDKHALETLPVRIEALHDEIKILRERLAEDGFYARDPNAFGAIAAKLSASEAELAAAEERWLELEMMREEIEG